MTATIASRRSRCAFVSAVRASSGVCTGTPSIKPIVSPFGKPPPRGRCKRPA
ncbi:MAG: hypothetical protein AB1761_16355 [Pseudomonadota bacterium]